MEQMEIVKRITGEDIPEQTVPALDEITGESVSDDTDNINDQSNGFDMLPKDFASENDFIQDAAWD